MQFALRFELYYCRLVIIKKQAITTNRVNTGGQQETAHKTAKRSSHLSPYHVGTVGYEPRDVGLVGNSKPLNEDTSSYAKILDAHESTPIIKLPYPRATTLAASRTMS